MILLKIIIRYQISHGIGRSTYQSCYVNNTQYRYLSQYLRYDHSRTRAVFLCKYCQFKRYLNWYLPAQLPLFYSRGKTECTKRMEKCDVMLQQKSETPPFTNSIPFFKCTHTQCIQRRVHALGFHRGRSLSAT